MISKRLISSTNNDRAYAEIWEGHYERIVGRYKMPFWEVIVIKPNQIVKKELFHYPDAYKFMTDQL